MSKSSKYTYNQLTDIYRKYAHLKGWSVSDTAVGDKVGAWLSASLGPVGLAIDFHETGIDYYHDRGINATQRANNAPIQDIVLSLSGTEYTNEDGELRQEIALTCTQFEQLGMRHEPKNSYDEKAIAVFKLSNRKRIGYMPKRNNQFILNRINSGFDATALLISIGASRSFNYIVRQGGSLCALDVNIVLFLFHSDVPDSTLGEHITQWKDLYRTNNEFQDWSNIMRSMSTPDPDSSDYRSRLGLTHKFSQEELRIAYKETAKKFNPDLHQHQTEAQKKLMLERMQRINIAFEFLRDTGV